MGEIVYFFEDRMYLNITNWCSNACRFCLKNFRDGPGGVVDLRLDKDPSLNKISDEVIGHLGDEVSEIIYCGIGEPMKRLKDVILPLSKRISTLSDIPIRIDTNGQARLFWPNENLTQKLVDSGVSRISISLNAEDHIKYNYLCRPKYIKNPLDGSVYQYIVDFSKECASQKELEVELTALRFKSGEVPREYLPNLEKCKEIANDLGVGFRERGYNGPSLIGLEI